MSRVRTVLGDIPAEELGVCYAHEHVFIGPSWATQRFPEFLIDDVDAQGGELRGFFGDGGRAVIDAMPCNCGRSAWALAELSKLTGVHIVAPTGVHLPAYYPDWHWSHFYGEAELAELFIADIEDGIDAWDYDGPRVRRTRHRAGVIKVAGGSTWTERENRIFGAAARAHLQTGCPILTHTEQGELALEQARFFERAGVDLSHVCLSHTDRVPDLEYHREILSTGVRLEYDSAFRWKDRPDNPTAELLLALLPDFPDQLMLGMDMARRSYWKCHGGGPGMSYLLTEFVPTLLERGLGEAALTKLFISTPAATFSFREDGN